MKKTCLYNKEMTKFEVGTSGYIGSKKDWLSMPYINCLEINSTFYKLPSTKTIEGFNEITRIKK